MSKHRFKTRELDTEMLYINLAALSANRLLFGPIRIL